MSQRCIWQMSVTYTLQHNINKSWYKTDEMMQFIWWQNWYCLTYLYTFYVIHFTQTYLNKHQWKIYTLFDFHWCFGILNNIYLFPVIWKYQDSIMTICSCHIVEPFSFRIHTKMFVTAMALKSCYSRFRVNHVSPKSIQLSILLLLL